ncbi:MAG: type II secretion system protein [bacterium]|nr:type II secretion system protein [bacterium]
MNIIKKGFTLIELLIVIALIGVLAVALISAINPVEQTRKANDTSRKTAAAEMLNAIERFQATFFCYPWDYDTATKTCGTGTVPTAMTDADLKTALTTTSKELKPEFFTRGIVTATGTNALAITQDTDDLVHICFVPESETFKSQATKDAAGAAGTTNVCVPE